MGRIIEAKAVISAEDRTGAVFDKIARKFREVGKGAKASAEVGRLAKQLDQASVGLKNIERFRSTQASFGQARQTFRATQVEVGRIARELEGARKAAAAFDGIKSFGKGGTIAAEIANTRKQVVELERQFGSAQRATKAAATAYESQAAALKGARHAYEGSGSSVGRLVADQARLKAAIEGTSAAILKQEAVARAEDRLTAGMGAHGRRTSAKLAQDRYLVDGMSAPARAARRRAGEAAAAHAADQARARADEARERAEHDRHIRRHGVLNTAAAGAAGYVSAHSVGHGIGDTLKAGATYQHEVVALQNAGRTPEEMHEIEHASRAAIAQVPTATFSENLKVINETTGAFGSLHHAIENLPFMQKSAAVLHASAGDKIDEGAGELGNKLARFFEMRGTAGNTEVFQKEASEMVRAMIFTRGNFNPGEMVNFAQQAKASLPLYTERFMSKIVPSLVTEYGGERAGTGANAFRNVIMGKANDKKQAEEWVNLGLLDKSQAVMKGGHAVSWKAGAVKDTNLALSDPLAWSEKVLIPALKAKGIDVDDKLELSKALGTMFRNSNSNMFAEAITQALSRQRLHKDEDNINKSATPDEAFQRNLAEDPTEAVKAFKASIESLMEATSGPAMSTAAAGLTALAHGIDAVALAAKDHPLAAMAGGTVAAGGALAGAGWLSYKILNGFGLGTSATALSGSAGLLDGAAAALTRAAAVQTAKGVIPEVVKDAAPAAGATLGAGGAIILGGAAAGAAIDSQTPGTNAGIGSLIFGGESSLEQTNRVLRQEREASAAGAPDVWSRRRRKGLPGADAGTGYSTPYETSGGVISDFLYGKQQSSSVLPGFGAGTKTIPVEVVSTRSSADPSGQVGAINNTLDRAATASATAANGGKPLEATVKPDQITAKVTEMPPVSGEATVTVDNHHQITVTLNTDMLDAKVNAAAGKAVARIPLSSSGARPGAVSMPGAATTPGAK